MQAIISGGAVLQENVLCKICEMHQFSIEVVKTFVKYLIEPHFKYSCLQFY